MTDHKPLFRRIIDAIHELQGKAGTIHEQSAAWRPAWPDCVSRNPRGGTAITPRQCVFANHYPIPKGSVLIFGEEVRRVTKATAVADDIGIAEWDEPIAAKPMKLLPADWRNRIAVHRDERDVPLTPLPIWRLNQTYGVIGEMAGRISDKVYLEPPADRDQWSPVRVGDSGMPVFIGGDTLVLLCCLATKHGGPSIESHWKAVKTWAPEAQEVDWSW
jgi:hypothetical protein